MGQVDSMDNTTAPIRPVVLHVLHRMGIGGAEVLVDQMVRNMADRYSFIVACLDEVGTLGESLLHDGVRVADLGRASGIDRGCIKRLHKLVADASVNLVHAHQYTPFFYSVAARGLVGRVPIVFTEHGRHFPDKPRWKRVLFNRLTTRKCDQIVGVGDAVKIALVKNEGFREPQVKVIYNGVAAEGIEETRVDRAGVRRELRIPQDAQIIIHVARLDYLKDHRTAVRAFARVAKNVPNVFMIIVGNGPEQAGITEEIQSLDCENRIRMIGERQDVPRLLKASDVMLLSSISEGIPLTIIEGMLAGLPVVSTAVGGVPELIEDRQQGFLVPLGEVQLMSCRLEQLLRSSSLRQEMGVAARWRAQNVFDERTMHCQYDALYRKLLF